MTQGGEKNCDDPDRTPFARQNDGSQVGDASEEDFFRSRKEGDAVRIKNFPTPGEFEEWRRNLRDTVCSIAVDPAQAMRWIVEVEKDDIEIGSLSASPKWRTLDAKLKLGLMNIINARPIQVERIGVISDRLASEGLIFGGRQVLRLVYGEFARDRDYIQIHAIQDLHHLKCGQGVDGLERFLQQWNALVTSLGAAITSTAKCGMFLDKVKDSTPLKRALEMVDLELRDESLQSKYDFVVRTAMRTIDIARQEMMRSAEIRARRPVANAMTATPEKASCYFWLRGHCPKGEKCTYLHQEGKKGSQPNAGMTKGRSKGKGKGGVVVDKQMVCRFFENGNCPLGDKCDLVHRAAENAMVYDHNKIDLAELASKKSTNSTLPVTL